MKINKKIAFSETGFVFDASTGDSYSMNPIGLEIIELIKQNESKEAIMKKLQDKYEVSSSQLEKSLDEFMDMLDNFNILENE
jgi:PqqD family protein of HPr-rel-A system